MNIKSARQKRNSFYFRRYSRHRTKRRLALMRQFGDINEIREATVAQLADVEGMNERAAESVYEFFHSVVYKTDTN